MKIVYFEKIIPLEAAVLYAIQRHSMRPIWNEGASHNTSTDKGTFL